MILNVDLFKAKLKNSYHFAKRNLGEFHAAHIVVQGSPLLVRIFLLKIIHMLIVDSFHLQDLFHSTVHRLKATGIPEKLLDNYLNADPYIPLPKQNDNKPLVFEQLIMLWLISGLTLTAGLFVFFGELIAGGFAKHTKKHAGATQQVNIFQTFNGRGALIENRAGITPITELD